MPPRASLMNPQETSLEDFRTSDVIFGTRGNGGNSSFLSRLEETADHYSRLSKYEKMECIKSIIAEWHGRFFIITPDGGCSQVYEFEASPSSKLYTSVRRMMNYVIKKKSVGSSSPGRQRVTNSRERKRLRRIKVLERVPIHHVQIQDHSEEEEASDLSVGHEDQHEHDSQPSFSVQRIAKLEDSAINVLVSLIKSAQD